MSEDRNLDLQMQEYDWESKKKCKKKKKKKKPYMIVDAEFGVPTVEDYYKYDED